jgi:excinuclease ABC subunit A
MMAADHLLDMGLVPERRGELLPGRNARMIWNSDSVGQYLSRHANGQPLPAQGQALSIAGATKHNLKGMTAKIPRSVCFTCVTGVSVRKSTMVLKYRSFPPVALSQNRRSMAWSRAPALDKVIDIDQSDRLTRRSNPAIQVCSVSSGILPNLPESVFGVISPAATVSPERGGRCEARQGDGLLDQMHFLPVSDLWT